MYNWIKQITLLLGDVIILHFSLFLSLLIRNFKTPSITYWNTLYEVISPLFIIIIIIFFITGLYDLSLNKNKWSFYQKILISSFIWLIISLIFFYIIPQAKVQPKTIIILTTFSISIFTIIWRFLYNKYLSKNILKTNIIFAGITKETIELINKINKEPGLGYEIIGIIENKEEINVNFPNLTNYKISLTLKEIIIESQKQIDLVIIAPKMSQNKLLTQELYQKLTSSISVLSLDKFYEQIFKRIPLFIFSEAWFLTNLEEQKKKIYDRLRFIVDYFFAFLMGIFFIISFIFIAPLLKLTSSGPVFFIQKRIGKNGKSFKMIKYRTMFSLNTDGSAEKNGAEFAKLGDSRITPLGNFLRKTRLDELPQFINIFKGEMSLVGPRPERPEFVEQLIEKVPYYQLRHLIKPGLTGWAQIQNSYYGTIDENLNKLEYDLYYLKNRSIVTDVIIILKTFNILGRMAGR